MTRLPRPSLILAAFLLPACSEEPPARPAPPNVLLITIDTLRADHLGAYGYSPYLEPVSPSIDAIARDGLVFERCFVPRGQTGPSLASMLTGCYPSRHRVLSNFRELGAGVECLAGRFAAAGYATHAFLAWLPLARASKASLEFDRGDPRRGSFLEAQKLPGMRTLPQSRWDQAAERACLDFLEERAPGDPPFFAWVHFFDVHQPYSPPQAYHKAFLQGYQGTLRMPSEPREVDFLNSVERRLHQSMTSRRPLEPEDARYVVSLYDGGIRGVDDRVGRIAASLDQAGLADETIVVVSADHGEELGEHLGFWFHGNSVYDGVLRVPLIVRGPGIRAGRTDALVQNLDLLPSLLDFVGAPRPADLDAISFARLLRSGGADGVAGPSGPLARGVAWSEWEHLILGARTPDWKYVLNPRGAIPKLPPYDDPADPGYRIECRELYDVTTDPGETRNVWRERKDDVEDLRALAGEEYARRFSGLTPGGIEDIDDPAEIERLRSLGYVAGESFYAIDPARCDDE